jgi:cytidine deaminase
MSPEQRQQLIEQALAARLRAYAPFSKFQVGAAVLTDLGQIHAGCNVENSSYGLTMCAERSAVFQAVAAGGRKLLAAAIAAKGAAAPCGACRQVFAEFADDLPVLLVDPANPTAVVELRLNDLLPQRFVLRTVVD